MRGSHHCYFLFACRLFTWQSQWRLPPQVQNVFDNQFRLPTIEIVCSSHPSLRHGWCVSASIFTIRENREYFLDTITLVPHDCGPLASQWHDIASPESCSACKVSSGTRPRTSFRKEHRADRRRSLSVSTLAAPSPPPGFDVDINYDTSRFLNPIGVYLCALDCMFHFDLMGWHQTAVRGLTIWADRHNVQLDLDSYVMTQGGPQLTTAHMVAGLYQTITDIAAGDRFCEVISTLSLYQRQIGTLRFEKIPPRSLEMEGGGDARNLSVGDTGSVRNGITYPSGRWDDPGRTDFSMTYTFSGKRINSKGIFLAVIDALAIAAQFDQDTVFTSLRGMSTTGNCVVNVVATPGPTSVSYASVTKAVRLVIADIMIPLNKFGEIRLQLKWRDVLMGEISVKEPGRGVIAR